MTKPAHTTAVKIDVDGHAVALAVAGPEDRPTLRNLMDLYLYDFSEYTDDDPDTDGWFEDDHLRLYWGKQAVDDGRVPYLIQVDGAPAGFVLVKNPHGPDFGTDHDIGEFFIMRKWRRHGIGRAVAKAVFALFPGTWEVRVMRENLPALAFWRRVIGECTGGQYHETDSHSAYWDGLVFTFQASQP